MKDEDCNLYFPIFALPLALHRFKQQSMAKKISCYFASSQLLLFLSNTFYSSLSQIYFTLAVGALLARRGKFLKIESTPAASIFEKQQKECRKKTKLKSQT